MESIGSYSCMAVSGCWEWQAERVTSKAYSFNQILTSEIRDFIAIKSEKNSNTKFSFETSSQSLLKF
jgi:hypothetical protein